VYESSDECEKALIAAGIPEKRYKNAFMVVRSGFQSWITLTRDEATSIGLIAALEAAGIGTE
jgi:hypothetical protein